MEKPPPLEQVQFSPLLCVGNMVLPVCDLIETGDQDSLLIEELAAQVGCSLEPLPSHHPHHCSGWEDHRSGHLQDSSGNSHHLG